MTVVPPLTGPASRVTAPPYRPTEARTASHARAASSTSIATWPYAGADVVALDAVVVGELEHGVRALVAVADERQRVPLLGPVGLAQQLHAEHVRVEIDRPVEVADAQHRVQNPHVTRPFSKLDHLEVFLARTAFRTRPVRRHVVPARARREGRLPAIRRPRRRSSRRSGTCIFSLRKALRRMPASRGIPAARRASLMR